MGVGEWWRVTGGSAGMTGGTFTVTTFIEKTHIFKIGTANSVNDSLTVSLVHHGEGLQL